MKGEIKDLLIRARCAEMSQAMHDTDTYLHAIGSPDEAVKKGYGLPEWATCSGAIVCAGDGHLLRKTQQDAEIVEAAIEQILKKRKDNIVYRKYTRPDGLTLFLIARNDEAIANLDIAPTDSAQDHEPNEDDEHQPKKKQPRKTSVDVAGENAKVL
jgi:hypothetical protein